MMQTLPVTELCLPGEACPIPVLKTKKALARMNPGELIRVISTDPHSIPDLKQFCTQTGHRFVSGETLEAEGTPQYVSVIEHKP